MQGIGKKPAKFSPMIFSGRALRHFVHFGVALSLFGVSPAFATPSGEIAQSVKNLMQLQRSGVEFSWVGNQDYAGEMLKITIKNTSNQPVVVNLEPWIILDPANGRSQRLMVETSGHWNLAPGQVVADFPVRCYCLDSFMDAPAVGEKLPMAFEQDLPRYEKEIEVLQQALELSKKGKLSATTEPLTHFTVVVQRALWMVYSPRNVLNVDLEKLMDMEAVPTKPDAPLLSRDELRKEFTEEMSGYNSGALPRVGLAGFGAEQFARSRNNQGGNGGGPSAEMSDELFEKIWIDINLILVSVNKIH